MYTNETNTQNSTELTDHIPTGYENAILATQLAEKAGFSSPSTVRNKIQELREQGVAIGGGQGLDGYWIIDSDDELQLFVENKQSSQETLQETIDAVREAYYDTTGVTYVEPVKATDGGEVAAQAPADVPDGVAEAVDVLVSEHGVEGAEQRLQEKFSERHDRAVAALGYLRYRYGGDQ